MSKKSSNFARKIAKQEDIMCMYNDELVQRTRKSLANEADMTIRCKARAAVEAMREISEQNGNSEMTIEDINREILQARQARKIVA